MQPSVAVVTTTVFLTLITGIVMGFGLMFYIQARRYALGAVFLQGTLEHHRAEPGDHQWTMIFIPGSIRWPKESWVFLEGLVGIEGPCWITIEPYRPVGRILGRIL